MQDEQKFIRILVFLCRFLNHRKVRYLIVGGSAVNAHGYYRPTTDRDGREVENPDYDIWFQPTYLNYMRLLDVFDDMCIDISRFREEAHPFPKNSFFRFKQEGYSLDFLPRLGDQFFFGECHQNRRISTIEETEVPILGLEELIASKKATGRKKDLEDVRALEALNK